MALLDQPTPSPSPVVLRMTGYLDLGTQTSFETTLSTLLDRGPVIVDLSRLEFLAISALRSLVVAHRYAHSRGRALVFAGASPSSRWLLDVAGLHAVLVQRDSVADARAFLGVAPHEVGTVLWPRPSDSPPRGDAEALPLSSAAFAREGRSLP